MKNKNLMIILAAFIIIIAGIFVSKNYIFNSKDADIVNEPDATYTELSNEKLPVLLEFRTDSCPACTEMEPVIREIKEKYEGIVEVRVLDVYENITLANQYKVKVVPTLFILSADGETLAGHEGYLTVEQIEEAFDKYLTVKID